MTTKTLETTDFAGLLVSTEISTAPWRVSQGSETRRDRSDRNKSQIATGMTSESTKARIRLLADLAKLAPEGRTAQLAGRKRHSPRSPRCETAGSAAKQWEKAQLPAKQAASTE